VYVQLENGIIGIRFTDKIHYKLSFFDYVTGTVLLGWLQKGMVATRDGVTGMASTEGASIAISALQWDELTFTKIPYSNFCSSMG
jgi:hypothetical protein